MRVFLSLVPFTFKCVHLRRGDTIVSMKGKFFISVSVSLEAVPAVQGELSVRDVWRVAGIVISSQCTFSIVPSLIRVLQDL